MTKDVYLLSGNLPLYAELRDTPPVGFKYIGSKSGESKVYYSVVNKFKRRFALLINETFKIPRMMYVRTKAPLIHSNRGILILNKRQWVMDLDYPSSFVGFNHFLWNKESYRKRAITILESKYCKRILAWSYAAQQALLNTTQSNLIAEKTEIMYPAVKSVCRAKSTGKKVHLLYVSSLFEAKGGREVLAAFERLRKKYDVKLTIKADVPEEVKQKYNYPEITYAPYSSALLPRDKLLRRYYSKADIFVYPTFCDIFGLGVLDAFSVGIPAVTSDVFAMPEIVTDGETGFIIRSPRSWAGKDFLSKQSDWFGPNKPNEIVVKQLVEKLSVLIEDSSLRSRMGRAAYKEVKSGKFSIKHRNKQLKRVYEEALEYKEPYSISF